MDQLRFEKLFELTRIGKTEIKNRIAMAPMGTRGLATPDGCFSERAVEYYVERARGGVGLIITGRTQIENEIERLVPGIGPAVCLSPARFVQSAGELTERVHSYGAKIFLQLGIGLGRVASPHMLVAPPVAPSAIPYYWDPRVTCRELTTHEFESRVRRSADAASMASRAGFDGVEIHALHEGYLADQFAIAMFNKRTDQYGGDLKGRLTLATQIVQAIKAAVGPDFPVVLRYSVKSYIKGWNQGALPGEKFEEKGRDIEEGLTAAAILEQAGYDAFDVDAGSYESWYWAHPPMYQPHGCYLPFADMLKRAVNVPIIVAGRLDVPEMAEQVLVDGVADVVSVGRGVLADPEWPTKVEEGRIGEIRPCVGCQDGCLGRIFLARPLSCAVNPACGREREYGLRPASEPKSVMVVGGGVAGLEAARVAALRGHTVDLYERTDRLGGHVLEASVPDFKRDEARLLAWYEAQVQRVGVKVHLNVAATAELILSKAADVLVIATGSEPIVPKIPGIAGSNVATASEVLLGSHPVGDKVAIIGGGLVGCETALLLARQGKRVTIVEMLETLMCSGAPVPHANKTMLLDLLRFHGVEILVRSRATEINDRGLTVLVGSANRLAVSADTIVVAAGMKPNDSLSRSLRGRIRRMHIVGDSLRPQNIMHAIWSAYEVSRGI